ncbi:MAG: hypothetical protein H8E15_10645 [Planctomycetes bacterium]|nr:hypothetical protein [Planctomycetota bacterium]
MRSINQKLLPLLIAVMLAGGVVVIAYSNPWDIIRSDTPPVDLASAAYNKAKSCKSCHPSGGTNDGGGSSSITGTPKRYIPGNVYPIVVRVAQPGLSRWGYQLTATDKSGNGMGAFNNQDNNSQIQVDSGREFVSHQIGGTHQGVVGGPVSWTVDWIAPSAGAGTAYFWMSATACDNDLTEFGDFNYNFARASTEAGTAAPGASIMTQPDFPISGINQLSRSGGETLVTEMRVTNHKLISENYVVVTRVVLPGGSMYPSAGYLSVDPLPLATGVTGTVRFSEIIPPTAPLGIYEFQATVGIAPSTFVDMFTFEFEVIP